MPIHEDFSLRDQNILITGASSGLGRAIALTCSEAGANIALVGRNTNALNVTLSGLKDGNHHCYSCDVTDSSNYLDLFNSIKNNMGLLAGFVHSAGIEVSLPLRASSASTYRGLFEVNTIAAFELSRMLLKKKYRADNVSIVFLASIMAVVGTSTQTAYAASKGALVAGMKSSAIEHASKGARFNAISPGFVQGTPMTEELFDKLPLNAQESLINNYPLGLGNPRDIGNASAFLLSDASRWITGINLMVDGGYTAQ